jgi:hypothetical protein
VLIAEAVAFLLALSSSSSGMPAAPRRSRREFDN